EYLDIEQRITIEMTSSYFDSELLVGGFSYPIQFAWNKHNERLLRNMTEVEVVLDVDGIFVKRCMLSFKRSDKVCNGYLKLDLGVVIGEMKKSIRQLVDEQVTLTASSAFLLSERMWDFAQAAPSSVPFVFFPMKNPVFSEPTADLVGEYAWYVNSGYINYVQAGIFDVESEYSYNAVPSVYLTCVLKKCFEKLGLLLSGEFIEDEEVKTWVFEGCVSTNWSIGQGNYVVDVWKYIPDVSLADLLKYLRDFEGVGVFVDWDKKTAEMVRMTEKAGDRSYVDLTGCELAKYEYGIAEKTGYVVRQMVDDADLEWKSRKYKNSFSIGKAEKEVDLKIGTVLMATDAKPVGGGEWLLPTMQKPGNILHDSFAKSSSYSVDTDDRASYKLTHEPKIRLLSYRGLQEDSVGILYPYATSTQATIDGTVVGNRMLRFDGASGQWYSQTEKYYSLLDAARPLQMELLIPLSKFGEIDLKEKVMMKIDRQKRLFFLRKPLFYFPAKNGKVKMQGDFVEILMKDFVPMPVTTQLQTVYAVIDLSNFVTEGVGPGGFGYYKEFVDVRIKLYLDEALTIPADVTELSVYVQIIDTNSGTEEQVFTLTTSSLLIAEGVLVKDETYNFDGIVIEQYTRSYSILANENYLLG
ncbi:hypothetical protein, partial [Emticicia sp.]|uniref:hypothetical protein n=1 Tax=Emticicia sp. TaxID=1930953 RepID=UPI003750EF07